MPSPQLLRRYHPGVKNRPVTDEMIDAELSGDSTPNRKRRNLGTPWIIFITFTAVAVIAGGIIAIVIFTNRGDDASSRLAEAKRLCQTAAAESMKDPSSAKLQGVTVEYMGDIPADSGSADGGIEENGPGEYWRVTGEVNAKNGFGAYAGFSPFVCETHKYKDQPMTTGYIDIKD